VQEVGRQADVIQPLISLTDFGPAPVFDFTAQVLNEFTFGLVLHGNLL
jgi:hypothetical protein